MPADGRWTGVIMEYTLREVLAERGQRVVIDEYAQAFPPDDDPPVPENHWGA